MRKYSPELFRKKAYHANAATVRLLSFAMLKGFPLEIRYLVYVLNFYLQKDFQFGFFSKDLMLVLVSNPLACAYSVWKMEGVASTGPRSNSLTLASWFPILVCPLMGDLLHPLDALDLNFPPYLEVCLVITHLGLVAIPPSSFA